MGVGLVTCQSRISGGAGLSHQVVSASHVATSHRSRGRSAQSHCLGGRRLCCVRDQVAE